MIRRIHLTTIVVCSLLGLAGSGCNGTDSPGGGVTVPETDNTPPTVSLLVDPEFGVNISVAAGGTNEATTIHKRTGKVSFLASANDQESGVRRLSIFMTVTRTRCESPDNCTVGQPLSSDTPLFESYFGDAKPGDTTSAGDILIDALDVGPVIGQGQPPQGGSITVKLDFHATSSNHHEVGARTAIASVTFRQEG